MIIKIFLYSFALSLLAFLPDRIWEKIYFDCKRFFGHLKTKSQQHSFFKESMRGDKLLLFFPQLEAKLSLGLKSTAIEIPQYKFYTGLIFDLLESHRKMGVNLKLIISELRENLLKELHFEKKIKSSVIGGNLQFFVITLTTWGFILFSSAMAELPLVKSDLMIIILLQLAGVFAFNFALNRYRDYVFLKFDRVIECMYKFVSVIDIGIPVEQILKQSEVLDPKNYKHKSFINISDRLTVLVQRWKDNGFSPKVESQEIIKELWNLKESNFEQFLKGVDGLKFSMMAFFFLPAYFCFLYSIFKHFMSQS